MAIYMVGYDIHPSKGETYGELTKALTAIGVTWWHCLDSTWLIVHPGPTAAIRNALLPHLVEPSEQNGDRLLVARLTGEMAWTNSFNADCQAWLRNNHDK